MYKAPKSCTRSLDRALKKAMYSAGFRWRLCASGLLRESPLKILMRHRFAVPKRIRMLVLMHIRRNASPLPRCALDIYAG